MDAEHRACVQVLDREVAIAHGVQAVGGEPAEAEPRCERNSIVVERGAGHGAGAERHAVGGLAGCEEALLVTLEGLDVREPRVGEQHGLGGLEVGVGRDRAVPGGARLRDERALERAQVFDGLFAQAHHAHAHEGCDLVVAAAAGVEPARGLAATPGQLGLDG